MNSKGTAKKSIIIFTLFLAGLLAGASSAQAQQSALVTSGMGGGASSTARLSAVQMQQKGRIDGMQTCGNKARFFGPGFGGNKDGDNCLTDITLTSGGDFGIGTTSPDQKLHVNGNAQIGKLLLTNNGQIAHADMSGNIASSYALSQNNMGQTFLNTAPGHNLNFLIGGGGNVKMSLTKNGDLGIGTTTPSAKLHVAGTLRSNGALTVSSGGAAITGNATFANNVTVSGSTTAQAYYHSSDRRLKENIRPLEEGESIVLHLKPVRFDWKQDKTPSMGFIAQDTEIVVPEAVITDSRGFKAVDYDMLAAPMVATLQAQQARITAQDETIRKLQAAVAQLQKQGR